MTAQQQNEAMHAALAAGLVPLSYPLPTDLQQALFEDDNVYHILIDEERKPGPDVRLYVGGYLVNWWPCLTPDRAQLRAIGV